jgi:hypothetical protein
MTIRIPEGFVVNSIPPHRITQGSSKKRRERRIMKLATNPCSTAVQNTVGVGGRGKCGVLCNFMKRVKEHESQSVD